MLSKLAISNKYARLCVYKLIKEAEVRFNRKYFPRNSARARYAARYLIGLRKKSWKDYNKDVAAAKELGEYDSEKDEELREKRREYIDDEIGFNAAGLRPNSSAPEEEYAYDVRKAYEKHLDNIIKATSRGVRHGFTDKELIPSVAMWARMANDIPGTVKARTDMENARQFLTRKLKPAQRNYVNVANVDIINSLGDNGSASSSKPAMEVETTYNNVVDPFTVFHEGVHLTYPQLKATPLNVASTYGYGAGDSGERKKKKIKHKVKYKGKEYTQDQLRMIEEARANTKARGIAYDTIAEGNIPKRQANALKRVVDNGYNTSMISYKNNILNESNNRPATASKKDIERANRGVLASNRANKINVNTIMDAAPADQLYNSRYGWRKSKGKINVIDAAIDKLQEKQHTQRLLGMTGEDVENTNNTLNWLKNNRDAVLNTCREERKYDKAIKKYEKLKEFVEKHENATDETTQQKLEKARQQIAKYKQTYYLN